MSKFIANENLIKEDSSDDEYLPKLKQIKITDSSHELKEKDNKTKTIGYSTEEMKLLDQLFGKSNNNNDNKPLLDLSNETSTTANDTNKVITKGMKNNENYMHHYNHDMDGNIKNVKSQIQNFANKKKKDEELLKNQLINLENIVYISDINTNNSEEIGMGGFSRVYKNNYKSLVLARKKLKFFALENFSKEIGIIKKLRHPSLPLFYGCYLENNDEMKIFYLKLLSAKLLSGESVNEFISSINNNNKLDYIKNINFTSKFSTEIFGEKLFSGKLITLPTSTMEFSNEIIKIEADSLNNFGKKFLNNTI